MRAAVLAMCLAALVAAGLSACGSREEGAPGLSDKYAGLDSYEAQAAARDIASDESAKRDSPAYRRSLFAGSATHSRSLSGEAAAWRVELTTVEEQRTGLCVWVRAEGTDPLNYDYLYSLDRCEAGSATD